MKCPKLQEVKVSSHTNDSNHSLIRDPITRDLLSIGSKPYFSYLSDWIDSSLKLSLSQSPLSSRETKTEKPFQPRRKNRRPPSLPQTSRTQKAETSRLAVFDLVDAAGPVWDLVDEPSSICVGHGSIPAVSAIQFDSFIRDQISQFLPMQFKGFRGD
ncbi:uncharacterized protein LOC133720226 [Rosa rugosa]|uniref:uncharacterized protein LOC133720226 n=1 Tax=Rosa rugosa TaxID=74645 RepID=UPI002B414B04|nr:uncharacterized protein LOC133720226 [Rosa rugosa]